MAQKFDKQAALAWLQVQNRQDVVNWHRQFTNWTNEQIEYILKVYDQRLEKISQFSKYEDKYIELWEQLEQQSLSLENPEDMDSLKMKQTLLEQGYEEEKQKVQPYLNQLSEFEMMSLKAL